MQDESTTTRIKCSLNTLIKELFRFPEDYNEFIQTNKNIVPIEIIIVPHQTRFKTYLIYKELI